MSGAFTVIEVRVKRQGSIDQEYKLVDIGNVRQNTKTELK
jgi:hypothetical protein